MHSQLEADHTIAQTRSLPYASTFAAPSITAEPPVVQQADSFDSLYIAHARSWFIAILFAYAISALSYVWYTPPWQSPDEPAHYNYVAYVAQERSLPVLETGDYDQALLDRILRSHFRPSDGVTSLRYEYHQPPLYYLLAAPVYWMTGGSLLALRLFSALIGACALAMLYLCLELVFPTKTLIVVGATALAALLPMHVSILCAVNNDGLAELLIMVALLVALSWMRLWFYADSGSVRATVDGSSRQGRRRLVLLGFVLGLGMLTKVYAYALLPILLATIVLVVWIDPRAQRSGVAKWTSQPSRSWQSLWRGVRVSLWTAIPALVLGSLWWIRNHLIYGGWDLLGLTRHATVVADQQRTGDWIAAFGWVAYGERAIRFTFQSFWGVFGWMGIFMDERIYTGFYLFTGIIFLGLLWAIVRLISGRPDADMDHFQLWVLGLFGVMIVAVAVAYLWYNLEFVQHQGRYLFWGLLPIGTVVALGWREVMQPLQGWITAMLALLVTAGAAVVGYVIDTLDKWTLLTAGCIVLMLLLQSLLLALTAPATMKRMPSRIRSWSARPSVSATTRWARVSVWALPFVLMFVLNLAIPHLYILRQLAQ
ncbi:MAG: hypothetical protein ACK2UO_00130 [Caldilineaceae bacterium]